MRVVSGWYTDDHVYLVMPGPDGRGVAGRRLPARWTLFLASDDSRVLASLQRDGRVERVSQEQGADGPILRVDCKSRGARYGLRDELAARLGRAAVLEADVDPLRRLFSDDTSLEVDPTPRLLKFDLEVAEEGHGIEEHRAGLSRIVGWAAEGSDGRYASHVIEEWNDDAEVACIDALIDLMQDYDVLVAYYGGRRRSGWGFDFDCLRARCHVLGIEPKSWDRWCWLDQVEVRRKYRRADGGEKTSDALDHVARHVLDQPWLDEHSKDCTICREIWGQDTPHLGKMDVDAGRLLEIWRQGPAGRTQILRYVRWDVHLMTLIEARTGHLALHLATSHMCRVFPDTEALGAGLQGDGFMLALGAGLGRRWPTKWWDPDTEEDGEKEGAAVIAPRELGVVDDVAVVDYAAMYPSIDQTWNMGLDTLVDASYEGEVSIAPATKARFRTDRKSIFVVAIEQLRAARKEYQDLAKAETPGSQARELYDNLSGAAKIVTNSIGFGIQGATHTRFYEQAVFESITTTGKILLERVVAWAESEPWSLPGIYGDTDSGFLKLLGRAVQHVLDFTDWFNGQLAPLCVELGARMPCEVKLECEKVFARICIISAKGYFGRMRWYKGKDVPLGTKPEIKGLATQRGDSLRLGRNMLTELIEMVLGHEAELPQVPGPLVLEAWLERWRRRIVGAALTIEDVVISQSISRQVETYFCTNYTTDRCQAKRCRTEIPGGTDKRGPSRCPKCNTERARLPPAPHARVAAELTRRGQRLLVRDRVRWVAATDPGSDSGWRPVPAEDAEADPSIVDRAYYWKRAVSPALAVLEVLHPKHDWKYLERDAKAVRKQAVTEIRSQDSSDLPLLAGLDFQPVIKTGPEDTIVVELCDGTELAAVDQLAAAFRRCRGRAPVRLVLVLPGAVVNLDIDVHVDPRLLVLCGVVRRDSDGVFRPRLAA